MEYLLRGSTLRMPIFVLFVYNHIEWSIYLTWTLIFVAALKDRSYVNVILILRLHVGICSFRREFFNVNAYVFFFLGINTYFNSISFIWEVSDDGFSIFPYFILATAFNNIELLHALFYTQTVHFLAVQVISCSFTKTLVIKHKRKCAACAIFKESKFRNGTSQNWAIRGSYLFFSVKFGPGTALLRIQACPCHDTVMFVQ